MQFFHMTRVGGEVGSGLRMILLLMVKNHLHNVGDGEMVGSQGQKIFWKGAANPLSIVASGESYD